LLIAVPLHQRRLRERGYNQALELARAMKQILDLPIGSGIAVRVRATPDQIGQSAAQRRSNLKGAFEIRGSLEGRHVALIDDVMTTGATLAELASACRAAGAARVEAWAIARAL
jgi:ComF family protein